MKSNLTLFQKVKRYFGNTDGSFGTVWAICIFGTITIMGCALDLSILVKKRNQAQTISDSVGLTAAIFVKENGRPPLASESGFVHNKKYRLRDLGQAPSKAGNLDLNAWVRVQYNEKKQRAEVYVSGVMATTFLGIIGKKDLEFTSQSHVNYFSETMHPASVFLILDNSGSMMWDDRQLLSYKPWRQAQGAQSRIDGLKSTVLDFNAMLETNINKTAEAIGNGTRNTSNTAAQQYLRTSMLAYNFNLVSAIESSPHWGGLPEKKIKLMNANGGTNSTPALSKTAFWMREENAQHLAMNGEKKPNKYVIFMTDGVNSYSSYNPQSIAICDQMKKEGVEIFTIGFALEPGYYGTSVKNDSTYLSPATSKTAYDFLRGCASSSDHFIKARDSHKLAEAFENIGKKISEDSIRVTH